MTDLEIAYLAGIVDGEGSISLFCRNRAKGYITPSLQVTNTDKRLIDWLHESIGGQVYAVNNARDDNRRQAWIWCSFGTTARDTIRAVRPFLRIKDRQADVVLALGEPGRRNGSNPLTADEIAERREAVAEIRELNRRGVVMELIDA